MYFTQKFLIDTPSITAKLISEQKDDKEKKNHEEKEKVKAENGFQDNYSVVVASGMIFSYIILILLVSIKCNIFIGASCNKQY